MFKDRQVWCVLGLVFDATTLNDAKSFLLRSIDEQRKCFLTTPNLNFTVTAQTDPDFFQSVIDSDLSIADGMPLIWVAKLLGIPITERVAGSSLFEAISQEQGRTDKVKVFFFGGQAGVAEVAHSNLNIRSQAMKSCGFYDPGFVSIADMSSPDIINKINETNPDFLVVALGAKKGQAWIQKNRQQLNAAAVSHLGAVINFVAGSIERAPVKWQRFGMEWLWRIRQEPTLWKRYFFDGLAFLNLLVCKALPLAIYDRYLKRSADFSSPSNVQYSQKNGQTFLQLVGSFHYETMESFKQTLSAILMNETDVEVECSELVYIDAAFIGTLLLFQRYLNENANQLILRNLPNRINYIFRLNNVTKRFVFISDTKTTT